jgi:hypothetical protein
MVLTWAPPRINGSSDPCSGVNQVLATRPRASEEFIIVNTVFYAFYFIFAITCLIIWWYYRRLPLLLNRSFGLVFLNFALAGIAFAVICIKRGYGLMDDVTGLPNMRCHVHFWLYVSLVPISNSTSVLRQISLINRGRYAKMVNQLPRYIPGPANLGSASDIGSSSMSISSSDLGDDPSISNMKICDKFSIRYLKYIFVRTMNAVKFGIGLDTFGVPHTNNSENNNNSGGGGGGGRSTYPLANTTTNTNAPTTINNNNIIDNEKRLLARMSIALDATKFRALFTLFVVFYSPVVLIVALTLPLTDPYSIPDCRGCDLYAETVIVLALEFVLFRIIKLALFRKIKQEDIADPDGVIPELYLAQIGTGPSGALAIILLATDPDYLDYRQIVAWEWFLCLGFFWQFCVHCPYQIFRAILDVKKNNNQTTNATLTVTNRQGSLNTPNRIVAMGGLDSGMDNNNNPRHSTRHSFVTSSLDLLDALKDDQIMNRFETFCIRHLVVEVVRFLREARGFNEYADDRSHDWIIKKANAIYTTYIKQGAPLQINISGGVRVRIEKAIKSKGGSGISKRLFEEAIKECVQVLRHTIWPQFCEIELEKERAILAQSSNKHMTLKGVMNKVMNAGIHLSVSTSSGRQHTNTNNTGDLVVSVMSDNSQISREASRAEVNNNNNNNTGNLSQSQLS